MSPSDFQVIVRSDDPLAVLTIVDARYKTQARGVGHLECRLPRGLYIARAHSGETHEQQKVRVSDGNVVIEFSNRVSLRSSAALEQSFDDARQATIDAALPVTPNATAWFVLALRTFAETDAEPSTPSAAQSAAGFELQSLNGITITSFGSHRFTPTPSGHAVAALRLAPGWYKLAMPGDASSQILLALYAGHFSPTVFVELRAHRSGPPRPDLDRVLVSYDDRESAIFRDVDRMRAIELARRSLVLGRNVLTPALMQILFRHKYADPMLGLFAAYLLLSDPNGATHFQEVVGNTGAIFGYPEHPDLVIARALGRQRGWWKSSVLPGDQEPLVAPPLLRAAWEGMLQLKDRSNEVVANESLRAVASSLIRSSAWVLWRTRPATSTARLESAPQRRKVTRGADALLSGLVEQLRSNPELASAFRQEVASEGYEGDTVSRTVARTALQLVGEREPVKFFSGYTQRLADALSVPKPLVADEISTMARVIEERLKTKVGIH